MISFLSMAIFSEEINKSWVEQNLFALVAAERERERESTVVLQDIDKHEKVLDSRIVEGHKLNNFQDNQD